MSKEKIKVSVQLLEKNYHLMCAVHERNALLEAAELFNKTLSSLRDNNLQASFEDLILLTGLQMGFEMILERNVLQDEISSVNQISGRLITALEEGLSERNDENVVA